jgi:hypothetical protein
MMWSRFDRDALLHIFWAQIFIHRSIQVYDFENNSVPYQRCLFAVIADAELITFLPYLLSYSSHNATLLRFLTLTFQSNETTSTKLLVENSMCLDGNFLTRKIHLRHERQGLRIVYSNTRTIYCRHVEQLYVQCDNNVDVPVGSCRHESGRPEISW